MLGKYINAEYVSANGTLSVTNPGNGTLLIAATGGDRPRSQRLEISPGSKPGTYYVKALNTSLFLSDDAALVNFNKDGRMQQIEGNLGAYDFKITETEARLSNPYVIELPFLTRISKTYTLDDGTNIPVSKDADSPLQKLHDSLQGFGLWETKIGQTFIGDTDMLRVEKNQAGHLQLTALTLEGKESVRLTFDKEPGNKGSEAKYFPGPTTQIIKTLIEQTELRMQYSIPSSGLVDQGDYHWRYFLRGDKILKFSAIRHSDEDDANLYATVYQPLTEARMIAAMDLREKKHLKAVSDAAYKERQAAERAAERRATENAIVSGFSRGWAQASQNNSQLNQMSQNFERDLNRKLQQIKSDQDKQREATKAAAARLMAANVTARQAAPSANLPGTRGAQVAQTSSGQTTPQGPRQQAASKQTQAARQNKEEAQRVAQQKADEEAARLTKLRQEKALKDHLAAERRGIRLQAATCPGGGGLPSAIGTRPVITPRVAQCLIVHFEARCPSERPGSGMQGTIDQFQGSGSCFDNSQPMPRKLACDVSQAIVAVTNVTTCP
ncbi:MAG: hypothetical protein LBE51_13510 [Acidovorax sp.]|jgi:hypothetical protein|nr:hypothetical protein [Acidovorax sp.]